MNVGLGIMYIFLLIVHFAVMYKWVRGHGLVPVV